MLALALGGGTVVVLAVVLAVCVLGWKAIGACTKEDVPYVTEVIMKVLRDGRHAVQHRVRPASLPPNDQASHEESETQ
ncbi:hypothetical protein [Streptomyces sp. R35]|uniref:Uncharacterized protein n=1 Tax=Streptomyces sp. R35 TaxID=3238630 RepID=A0AB39SK15_9ACTN